MAMKVTRRDIEHGMTVIRREAAKAERAQAQKETYMGQATQTLEVFAGAVGSGFVAGRYGQMSLGPIPADVLVGLGIHALGFTGLLGKYAGHAHNVGDGVLAGYGAKFGAGLGTEARLRAGQSPFTTSGGDGYAPGQMGYGNPMQQGGGLTEDQLAQIAAMG